MPHNNGFHIYHSFGYVIFSSSVHVFPRGILLYLYTLCSAGPPSRPKGPLKVEDVRKDRAKIKWEKPEDDGGEPIT